jgi:hypothetical protein
MDPITGAVIAIITWFALINVGYFVFSLGCAALGTLVGGDSGGVIGAIIGYILGVAWSIFAVVKLILEIVNLLQLIAG